MSKNFTARKVKSMLCFKGFNADLEATCGNGRMKFEQHKTYIEMESKTVRSGFHCAEYPMHCLVFYPLGCGNRYFKVEAAGDIDDEETMIACTQLTVKEELTLKELVQYTLLYIMRHPERDMHHSSKRCEVWPESSIQTQDGDGICIAYGKNPKVKASRGNYIGLIKFMDSGEVVGGMWKVGTMRPEDREKIVPSNTWLTVDDIGNLIEDEELENEREDH